MASAEAWKVFEATSHKPPEEEGPEPTVEVEEIEEPKDIGNGNLYVGSFD